MSGQAQHGKTMPPVLRRRHRMAELCGIHIAHEIKGVTEMRYPDLTAQERSVLHVDLDAIRSNARALRRFVGPRTKLCALLKSNAYGMSARHVPLAIADSVNLFAVYDVDDLLEVLAAGIRIPVLVLSRLSDLRADPRLTEPLRTRLVQFAVSDANYIEQLRLAALRLDTRILVHLEVDTGMNRSGCDLDKAADLIQRIDSSKELRLHSIFTHFSSAQHPEPTCTQLARFLQICRNNRNALNNCYVHAANTAATLRDKDTHLSMVRIGLGLFGYGEDLLPSDCTGKYPNLTPAVRWTSRIDHLRNVKAGSKVGYEGAWTAPCSSTIGLVPVGYGDGYPFCVPSSGRTPMVRVFDRPGGRSSFCPIVGRLNMDQMSIDLTAAMQHGTFAPQVGSAVELISSEPGVPTHLPQVARSVNTIPHAILVNLSSRIRRIHVGPSKPKSTAQESGRVSSLMDTVTIQG